MRGIAILFKVLAIITFIAMFIAGIVLANSTVYTYYTKTSEFSVGVMLVYWLAGFIAGMQLLMISWLIKNQLETDEILLSLKNKVSQISKRLPEPNAKQPAPAAPKPAQPVQQPINVAPAYWPTAATIAAAAAQPVQPVVPQPVQPVAPQPYQPVAPQSVKPILGQNGVSVVCPVCGEVQPLGRNVCWSCGVKFTDDNDSGETVTLMKNEKAPRTSGACDYCGKEGDDLYYVKITDKSGSRFKKVCPECADKPDFKA